MNKIKVIVVDDSKFIRTLFTSLLNETDDIEVIDSAEDAFDAREKIKKHNPDVITLDVEMPRMDGISFLEKIMTLKPMPVVMVSSITNEGADVTLKALEIGAVDYITKPSEARLFTNLDALRDELTTKIRNASKANINATHLKSEKLNLEFNPKTTSKHKIVAIGASTGGVEAIRQILIKFPKNTPPVLITQHMPEKFTEAFAKRLDNLTELRVQEARNGQKLHPGNAYIAPGGLQMKIIGNEDTGYAIKVDDSEPVTGHKPSVDHLFSSVAEACGKNAIGVILTGMGNDGAKGMLEMKKAGSYNIGQNRETCVVYGMPKVASEAGAVDLELPLEKIAAEILKKCE